MSDQLMHFLHNMSGNCYFLAISPTPLAYRAEVAKLSSILDSILFRNSCTTMLKIHALLFSRFNIFKMFEMMICYKCIRVT